MMYDRIKMIYIMKEPVIVTLSKKCNDLLNLELYKDLDYTRNVEILFKTFRNILINEYNDNEDYIKFIINKRDYENNLEDYSFYDTLFLLSYNKEKNTFKFVELTNKDYKDVLNYVNDMYNEIKQNSFKNLAPVRWLGAFNTETTDKRYDFEEVLEYEYSSKDREVACDVFADFSDYNFIECYKERYVNAYDNLYARCKLAFVYDSNDLSDTFESDVWSKQLGAILVGTNEDYTELRTNNPHDYCGLTYHSEGFLKIGVQPKFMLICKKDSWDKRKLKVAEKFAEKHNLTILYINNYNNYMLYDTDEVRYADEYEDIIYDKMYNYYLDYYADVDRL